MYDLLFTPKWIKLDNNIHGECMFLVVRRLPIVRVMQFKIHNYVWFSWGKSHHYKIKV